MDLISVEERNRLIDGASSVLKLELRDRYAVDEAVFKAWRSGDKAAIDRAAYAWAEQVTARLERGMSMRRIKVVSEPLSEYHRFNLRMSEPLVEAGEDIRWLPRRLTSALLLPGNDAFVLDYPDGDTKALFNVLDGDDNRAEQQVYTDAETVELCRGAFEAAWSIAVPYAEFRAAHVVSS